MSDKFVMSSRQAAELDYAFERNNWTPGDVKLLSSGNTLARILPVLRGHAEINVVKHTIDCDADPLIPYEDWKIKVHTKRGQVEWDPFQFKLHLSASQEEGNQIQGHELRKEVEGLITGNANLLDYLVDHPHLIPGEWKVNKKGRGRAVLFWSTVYRDSQNRLHIRYLHFIEGHWQAYHNYLGNVLGDEWVSIVCAS